MATVKGTPKTDKFTVNEVKVIVATGKKSKTLSISKKGKNRIFGADAKDTFTVKGGKHNYIYGDKGNDVITVTGRIGSGNKIYGDDAKGKVSGKDTFNINAGKKNYFYGGKGVDTFNINGGTTNYLYGGAGKDTYIFGKKKATATIKDYVAGQDTLKVNSGVITSTTVKGKDVTFKAGNASVTVAGAAKKTISLKDSQGSYWVSSSAIQLSPDFKGEIDVASYLNTIECIDGSSATGSVTIRGGANTILLYGGAGNDFLYANSKGTTGPYLYGNGGNDELHGDGKSELYGEGGNDKLYGQGDTLDGGVGNDALHNGVWMDGGTGSDILYCGSATKYMYGGNDTDKDRFFFSSDSCEGTDGIVQIYQFKASDDFIAFKDEGANTVAVREAPERNGSNISFVLTNNICVWINDYTGNYVTFYDERSKTYETMQIVAQT